MVSCQDILFHFVEFWLWLWHVSEILTVAMTDVSDKEAQQDELLALASIYDDTVFSASQDAEQIGGQFLANIELPESFKIRLPSSSGKGIQFWDSDFHTMFCNAQKFRNSIQRS